MKAFGIVIWTKKRRSLGYSYGRRMRLRKEVRNLDRGLDEEEEKREILALGVVFGDMRELSERDRDLDGEDAKRVQGTTTAISKQQLSESKTDDNNNSSSKSNHPTLSHIRSLISSPESLAAIALATVVISVFVVRLRSS